MIAQLAHDQRNDIDQTSKENLMLARGMALPVAITCLCVPPSAAAETPAAPAPVAVERARREDVPVYRTGMGRVQAYNSVTVRTQVDGQLQQVLFAEGQMVARGDLLAVIDPRPYQAALDEAQAKLRQDQAQLANAELVLSRYSKLASESFASAQTLDNQRAQVAQLQAQVAQDQAAIAKATTQLSYTRITSSVNGLTGLRLVDQGNLVRSSDANGIVVVNQIQPISVISSLPAADLAEVRAALNAGQVPAEAFDDTGTKSLGEGTLRFVDNGINPASGTFNLKSEFPNADSALWPGQSVRLRVVVRIIKDALTIGSDAVQRGPNGEYVYVVQSDDTVRPLAVTVSSIFGGRAVIDKGIAAGDRVVVQGQYRLTADARVTVQPLETSGPPAKD